MRIRALPLRSACTGHCFQSLPTVVPMYPDHTYNLELCSTVQITLDVGGSISCISIVGISLTKLQSGSGPEYKSPDSRGPPEKTRFGPSENRCLTAAVDTAVTGIRSKQRNMIKPFFDS